MGSARETRNLSIFKMPQDLMLKLRALSLTTVQRPAALTLILPAFDENNGLEHTTSHKTPPTNV